MFTSLVIGALGTLLLVYYIYFRNRNLPPGPYGLPFVGYIPFLGKNPIRTFTNLKKKYGNVSCISLGMNNIIVLNDIKSMKEALVKQGDIFSGRPNLILSKTVFNSKDITFTDGRISKEQRTFSLQTLREFGLGKSTMETIIMDQVDKLTAQLMTNQSNGHSFDVSKMFFIPLMNVLLKIVAGKQFHNSDEYIQNYKQAVRFVTPSKLCAINHLPFLRFLIPGGLGYEKVKKYAGQIQDFIRKEVDQHEKEFQENNLRDFIDSYLSEIAKRKEKGTDQPPFNRKKKLWVKKDPLTLMDITVKRWFDLFFSYVQGEHMVGTVLNLFVGGIQTSDTTLSWALLYMALNPEIQVKVQTELDTVMAKDSFIPFSAKTRVPYAEATLFEVHRYATVLPVGLPHRALKDTTLFGYKIPKDSTVYVNLFAIHHDEDYWTDPEVFRPERFLDETGTAVKTNESLVPFSIGPKKCIGESLAKMQLFLFFTCLLRRFTFELVSSEPKPSLEPVIETISRPKPFNLIIKPR